ncbi:MAG: fluoride efflux transporter CrcB, partial [Candidatus Kapabacteria bacterium]|nr:fluoride efflux transporter CrcB [Candidatus Kapabacteria bacterium]
LVGIGGFDGSAARFALSEIIKQFDFSGQHYATLIINIVGSFILGILSELVIMKDAAISSELALFLTVGLCGGFTTFSTFSLENINLLRQGLLLEAGVYITLSVIGALVFFAVGLLLVKYTLAG